MKLAPHQLTKHCKHFVPLLAASAALLLSQGQAKAILNVNIFDDDPNLKVTVQGPLSQLGTPGAGFSCSYNGLLLGQSAAGSALCTGPNIGGPSFSLTGPLGFGGNRNRITNQVQGQGFFMVTQSYTNRTSSSIPPPYVIDPTYSNHSSVAQPSTVEALPAKASRQEVWLAPGPLMAPQNPSTFTSVPSQPQAPCPCLVLALPSAGAAACASASPLR
jgi:hypothetical protein